MTVGGRTALVVVTREAEPVLAPSRRRHIGATVDRGIPAHITVLFPFVPALEVDAEISGALRALYAPVEPFAYDLASLESFPGYAWLAPDPGEPFLDLIAITRDAFPDLPPYGERDIAPVPHCTVGAAEDPDRLTALVAELQVELGAMLPIRCHAEAVTLLAERADETWFERRAFAFTGGA